MRMVRQLGREDWIAAGMEALVACGPAGVAVQALARRLGVSKGSFYWHFRDRAALRDAMLDYWEHRMMVQLLREARPAERGSPPAADPATGPGGAGGLGTGARSEARSEAGSGAGLGGRLRRAGQGAAASGPGPMTPTTGGGHATFPDLAGAGPLRAVPALQAVPALRDWAREDAAVARRLASVASEAGRPPKARSRLAAALPSHRRAGALGPVPDGAGTACGRQAAARLPPEDCPVRAA